jgi:sortase A
MGSATVVWPNDSDVMGRPEPNSPDDPVDTAPDPAPVIAPWDEATTGTGSPRSISLPILQQFCERLVAEAVTRVREEFPGTEAPTIDWGRLWVTLPAASPEMAAGRAAVVAQQIASEILEWKQSVIGTEAPIRLVPASIVPAAAQSTGSPGEVGEPVAAPTIGAPEKLIRRNRRLRRAFVAFGWMRDIGLILIAFAAWQLWGTSIEQSQAQQTLRQQFDSHLPSATPPAATTTAGPALISAAITVPTPPEGSVVGRLRIPAIGVDQFVVEGTSEGDLSKGPGHYIGTSMPGQAGNVAIAGHRTTYGAPFNNLNALKVGDQISLTSNSGAQLTYVVSASPVAVSPKDVAVLNSGADNRLTLTTCNPRFSSSQRLVVVADLRTPHTIAVSPTVARNAIPRRTHIVSEPIGWNTGFIPIVLFLAALLVGLGLANRRARHVYGRIGRWLVLTPIWVAGLFFLFESLTRLLPANL